ncbi:MAG TPA: dihydrofolate reductase [Phnomibacter sp.]|nr:dihydrofolate reductase [Phnomibacter sp.]
MDIPIQVNLIVAAALNHAIGANNQLLWHLPEDMRFFKNTTWGLPIIMGRKTFESLGKPLPGRSNIVLTRQAYWQASPDVVKCSTLEEALLYAQSLRCRQCFVIGGAQVYKQALPYATQVYLTRVHTAPAQADAFFEFPIGEGWQCIFDKHFEADAKHAYAYTFETWQRKPTKP